MKIDLTSRPAYLAVAFVSAVALCAVNNGPQFWLHETPGDLIDGRFNMFVLEHIYQWLIGRAGSLVSPAIFYPFPDVLFFSDNHAGSVLIYALFRALGKSEYIAYDSWFLVGYLTTFAAAYYAMARFGAGALSSALGAAIFAFGLPSLSQFGHAQLVYRCGVPLALLYLWWGLRDRSERYFLLSFVCLCFQFLLSIYLGMFLLILMAAFAIAALLCEPDLRRRSERRLADGSGPERTFNVWRSLQDGRVVVAVLLAILGAAATLAMFAGYAHASREYGFKREWTEIAAMIPRPVSYLLMAKLPYWAPISAFLSQDIPVAHEHDLFMGFGALGFFLVGLLAVVRNSRAALGATPARAMAIALLLVVLVTTFLAKDFTLYYPLAFLPGLNAIRAVTRIGLVLAFPAALIAAVGMQVLVDGSKPKMAGILIAALLVSLTGYEFVTTLRSVSPIQDSKRRVRAIVAAAQERASGVRSPILLVADPTGQDLAVQLDAMLAAQKLGWPTINGYSGNSPPGETADADCALAARQLGEYQTWRTSRPGDDLVDEANALMVRVVFVGADCDSDPLNRQVIPAPRLLEPTSEAVPANVTIEPGAIRRAGSDARFTVTIKNNSADQWIPGRSSDPVSLSWRFVPVSGAADPDEGWDPRERLPTDIAPGGAFAMAATAAVPTKPGDYRLEVSLVADGLFWFHDEGMQPLRFEQIVTVP